MELLTDIRDDVLGGVGRGGGPDIGDEVEQRGVLLVADGADDRGEACGHQAAEGLVGERQQVFERAAAAGDDDHVDLGVAVECAANGAFFATGQRCTASSRLVVTDGIHDRFVAALAERMKTLVVDDALKAGTQIGPAVDQSQLDQDLRYIEIGRQEGARLVAGGERLTRDAPGYYVAPALFTDVANDMRIAREEIFGPVAAVGELAAVFAKAIAAVEAGAVAVVDVRVEPGYTAAMTAVMTRKGDSPWRLRPTTPS